MTRVSEEILTCPNCGHEQPFTHYDSVNVSLDLDLKERLLSRELTTFCCSECGTAAEVVAPMLYHDMNQQLMIWLIPGDDPVPPDPFESGPLSILSGGLKSRCVRSFNELVEKIRLFDDGLDDRIIELSKLLICLQEPSFHDGELFFDGLDEADEETAAHFVHLEDEEGQTISVSWEDLLVASQGLLDSLSSSSEEDQKGWAEIDREWATSVFAAVSSDD
jgi:hypothetical protein